MLVRGDGVNDQVDDEWAALPPRTALALTLSAVVELAQTIGAIVAGAIEAVTEMARALLKIPDRRERPATWSSTKWERTPLLPPFPGYPDLARLTVQKYVAPTRRYRDW